MAETKIEWATKVWNPVTGCTPISEGCQNCYAQRMSKRLGGRCGYSKVEPFEVTFHLDKLEEPRHWRKPSRIFVCSMGDLFHDDVPEEIIDKIFAIMAMRSQHTYLLLTKRADNMRRYFYDIGGTSRRDWIVAQVCRLLNTNRIPRLPWPLPNVWLGMTAENQARADERIPILLQTPAAKRFISIEPMLGPVNLQSDILGDTLCRCDGCMDLAKSAPEMWQAQRIDWVICGGETGPGARPMHPDWVRSRRDQCQASGTPFFFKSWGDWGVVPFPMPQGNRLSGHWRNNRWQNGVQQNEEMYLGTINMTRIGKKAAGRLLDGREWNQFPGVNA